MYEDDLIYAPNGGTFGIRSIFEDRRGDFWLCNTRNRFVFDFDKTAGSDRLEYVKTDGIKDEALFNGAESIYFSHILEDPEGSIWLTHWTLGAFKYDGSNITRYSVKDGDQEVNLVSMYKDRQGNLWVGTPENGVFQFNGASFERFNP
jgi:streptogramin lyase